MASDNIAQKGEDPPREHDPPLLDTDARVLAYLRAAMLESGDDPKAMAAAIHVVEAARAKLRRREPLRVASAAGVTPLAAKRVLNADGG
jgi:DNA-binding phage protein